MGKHVLGEALKLLGLLLISIGLVAYIVPYIPIKNTQPISTSNTIGTTTPPKTTATYTRTTWITETKVNHESSVSNSQKTTTTFHQNPSSETITCKVTKTIVTKTLVFSGNTTHGFGPIIMDLMKYSSTVYTIDFINNTVLQSGPCNNSESIYDEAPECYYPPIWIGSTFIPRLGRVYVFMPDPTTIEIYANGTAYMAYPKLMCNSTSVPTPFPGNNTIPSIYSLLYKSWLLEIGDMVLPVIFNWTPEFTNVTVNISYKDLIDAVNSSNHYFSKIFVNNTSGYCTLVQLTPAGTGRYMDLEVRIGGIPIASYDTILNIETANESLYNPKNYNLEGYYNWVELPRALITPGLLIQIEIPEIKLYLTIQIIK